MGPFYPREAQIATRPGAWRDNDLTEIPGVDAVARGQRLVITGKVLDADQRPVDGAVVEIWQACLSGRYLSTKDRRRSRKHDPAFQYWGSCSVGDAGDHAFKTIVPPAYPSGVVPGWIRPPHIHVQVRAPGLDDFVTQLYFDETEQPDNAEVNLSLQRRDLLLMGVVQRKRDQLIRPVRALSAEPLAMLDDTSLDDGLPWAGLDGARRPVPDRPRPRPLDGLTPKTPPAGQWSAWSVRSVPNSPKRAIGPGRARLCLGPMTATDVG